MIFITKTTQILEVLYPDNILTSDFEHVALNILPTIQELVSNVDTPLQQEKPIEFSKYSIQCVSDPQSDKIETDIRFIEDSKRLLDDSWKETIYGDMPFLRNDGYRVIRGESCRIDTNWDYLVTFFDSLQERTAVNVIEGLNKKKLRTLARFYDAHPNFNCHIETEKGFNVLVKDEVRVSNDTRSNDDSGTVDASTYGNVE